MTKRILFFATEKDLLPIFAAVESVQPLDYVRMGPSDTKSALTCASGANLPSLGRATSSAAGTNDEFMVVLRGQRVAERSVNGIDGNVLYFFDQLENPASITFSPGGRWEQGVLLHGRVATVSEDAVSQTLMKEFAKAVRKTFSKIKAYWVGPEAEALLDAGVRLTISADASRDFDLSKAA
jgi:hypothetical protein